MVKINSTNSGSSPFSTPQNSLRTPTSGRDIPSRENDDAVRISLSSRAQVKPPIGQIEAPLPKDPKQFPPPTVSPVQITPPRRTSPAQELPQVSAPVQRPGIFDRVARLFAQETPPQEVVETKGESEESSTEPISTFETTA